jgi:predicted transcriptional regulator
MSPTIAVAQALLDASEPLTAAEIADQCDLDSNRISQVLFQLIQARAVERIVNKNGGKHTYQVADQEKLRHRLARGTKAAAAREAGTATEAAKPNGKERPKKRNAKNARRTKSTSAVRRKSAKQKQPAPPRPAKAEDAGATLSFFIDENGAVQIMRADGAGEAAIIPAADARRLAAFLNRAKPMLSPPTGTDP